MQSIQLHLGGTLHLANIDWHHCHLSRCPVISCVCVCVCALCVFCVFNSVCLIVLLFLWWRRHPMVHPLRRLFSLLRAIQWDAKCVQNLHIIYIKTWCHVCASLLWVHGAWSRSHRHILVPWRWIHQSQSTEDTNAAKLLKRCLDVYYTPISDGNIKK